jgi:hypothetical protein
MARATAAVFPQMDSYTTTAFMALAFISISSGFTGRVKRYAQLA